MSYLTVILADAPVAYWRFADWSGTVAAAVVGPAGTIAGSGVTYRAPGALLSGNRALTFDGLTGRVTIAAGALAAIGTGPFSLEAWFKRTASDSPFLCDTKGGPAALGGYALQVSPTQVTAYIGEAGTGAFSLTTSPAGPWNDDAWHYLVLTLERGSPDTLRIYLDAVLVGITTAFTPGWDLTSADALQIGSTVGDTDWYAGSVDEVALYHSVLDATQVAAHYAAALLPTEYTFRIRHDSLQIRDSVGEAPTTLSLTVQGERPPGCAAVRIGLEPDTLRLAATIAGFDAAPGVFDGDPLFEGVLQTVEERYEGLLTQLAWDCTAIDHTYELNKRRPFGSFEDVAAHVVVETIMGTYAPDFDLAFVQQIDVEISITFDGAQEMSACLSAIATQLGSCHWYLDLFALHFYHLGINDGDVPVSPNPPDPGPLTAPTVGAVARGAGMSGWMRVSMTFVYSNGLESLPSDSILVDVDHDFAMEWIALPIGAPYVGLAVVKRYLYYDVLGYTGMTQRFVAIIPDNTATTYRWDVTADGFRARVPPARLDPAPAPTTAPTFTVATGPTFLNGIAGNWQFAVAFVYETGIESVLGPLSTPVTLTNYAEVLTFASLPIGAPNVDGKVVLFRTVYASFAGDHTLGYFFIPNNTATAWEVEVSHAAPATLFEWGGPVGGPHAGYDFYNYDPSTGGAPTFGPSLEDDLDQPDPLVDDSPTLIHDDPPLTSGEDATQLRTRVYLRGAATTTTVATTSGSVGFNVASVTMFDPGGGQVLVDGQIYPYASVTTGVLSFPAGVTVGRVLPIGTPVSLWVQVDDYQAQAELGEREAVAGVPSDGVREYTIVATELDSVQDLLARGYAELALYARPILTVRYGTFDRKTRAGRLIAIDLTDPPLQHAGLLIQDVTIDRIDGGPVPWPPRYTVTASSVRFTLDDLLRKVQLREGG